jgi:aminobenzoyl-glutamate utilization protein B
MRIGKMYLLFGLLALFIAPASSQNPSISPEQGAEMKQQILKEVDGNAKLVQVMIDTLYSYGELGFQEFETSKYLTALLEKNGFKVEHGIS